MHHLHPFFKIFLWETRPPYFESIKTPFLGFIWSYTSKVKILPHHVYRRLVGKNYTQINMNSAKSKLRIHHLLPFFKKKFSERPDPPLLWEDKKLPFWALIDPLQLRWKSSRITWCRSFEGKNYTQFFGKNQH